MENYFFNHLNLRIKREEMKDYDKLTIYYLSSGGVKLVYNNFGQFCVSLVDKNTICVTNKKDDKMLNSTFITSDDNGYTIKNFDVKETISFFPGYKDIKKVIIPGPFKMALYSYQYGIVVSSLYDKIMYDNEDKMFYVEYYMNTSDGYITLFGSLDTDGHLIDDTLYSPLLKKEFLVDEHNLDNSINKYSDKIEELLLKRKKELEAEKLLDYECECYLRRKKNAR